MKKQSKAQSGFTLVELAIVLVIIGLLVGGVLAGADLIRAATMQKAIKQLTDTDTAIATFRTKYNALPGDFTGGNTAAAGKTVIAGIDSTGVSPGAGNGDGAITGLLSYTPATPVSVAYTAQLSGTGEVALVYAELANEGYIRNSKTFVSKDIATPATNGFSAAAASSSDTTFLAFATGALVNTPLVVVQSFGGDGYMNIVGNPSGAAAAGVTPWTAGLTPAQAQNIDGKQDDGAPFTGRIRSIATTAPISNINDTASVGAAACVVTATSVAYNSGVLTQVCNLSMRASF